MAFPSVINLGVLTTPTGIRIDGAATVDRAGGSVSGIGDINGDGFDDVIIGARYADPDGGTNNGASYVVFGKAAGIANIDLLSLAASDGFRLDGVFSNENSGWSVSGAGDVNGDGIVDLVIGARGGSPIGYVVFGQASGFGSSFDLSNLDGSNGFRFVAELTGINGHISVSGAGDVNDDGFDDVVIGSPDADPGATPDAGTTYVVYGQASAFSSSIDLSALDGTDGFRIESTATKDYLGQSVADAGDVNGDGIHDIVVGAMGSSSSPGSAYVIFGNGAGFASNVALSSLDGSDGFRLNGQFNFDQTGYSVSGAGDVNGDGFDDVIVGAPLASSHRGASYVVFGGPASGFAATLALTSLAGSNGFRILGATPGAIGDNSGFSVSGAGDVDGDGFDDLLIGAPYASPASGGTYAGSSYVVFGKASGFFATVDLSSLGSTEGFRMDGRITGDRTGSSVSAAGDLNDDGFDDFIVGALMGDGGSAGTRNGSGVSYVIYGQAPTDSVTRAGTAIGNTIYGGSDDDHLLGLDGNDRLYGLAGDDTLEGGNGYDRLTGGTGADQIQGGDGNDRIWLANGDWSTGESVFAGNDVDTMELTDATTVNFAGAVLDSLERLVGSDFDDTVTVSAFQWADLERIDLRGGTDTLLVRADANILAAGQPGVRGVETGGLVGTAGTDSAIMTGRQLDGILIGAGTIDFGGGDNDQLTLNGRSRDLEALIGTDAAISGLEALSFEAKTNFSVVGQSEGFGLRGSSFDDRLTGGNANDTLVGGAGNDTLTGGTGTDIFAYFVSADGVDRILDFTAGQDQIGLVAFLFGGGLVAGALPSAAFFAAADPLSDTSAASDGRFLYDNAGTNRGMLYWDVDGGSGPNAVALARLTGTPALSATDFLVV